MTLHRPNLTSEFAPPPANVTFSSYRNVYVYSAVKLWIAYGLALLSTSIAVAIGLIAVVRGGASYSDDFSSTFRVARATSMKVELKQQQNMDGKDPLPLYLSKMELVLDVSATKGIETDSPPNQPENETLLANAESRVPVRRSTR